MNIPIIQSRVSSPIYLAFTNHSKEMENFSKHLFIEHKMVREKGRGDRAIQSEVISGISPKVFVLLMQAQLDLFSYPTDKHPEVGIMIQVPLSYGELYVYSSRPRCWTMPTAVTRYLGFTFIFKEHAKSLGPFVTESFPNLQVIAPSSCNDLIVGSDFAIGDGVYLSDIKNEVIGLINQLSRVDTVLKTRSQ